MAFYKYVGRNAKGTLKTGTVEADSRQEAIRELREKGLTLRSVEETKGSLFNKNMSIQRQSVKNRDFVIYCRQFGTLIRAGIPIVEATNILSSQTESKALAKTLRILEKDIREGQAFSEAAKKHPKIFPMLFVNMIRTGELTGSLDDTLDRLADYYEKQYNLQKKVQSTLAYPAVLTVLIIGVVIFLMVSIVPNFTSMFEQLGGELPLITQWVVRMSDIVQTYWWVLLLMVVAIILAFSFLFKQNDSFHYYVHLGLLKMPIFGKLLQKAAIARMTRTLSSLFSSSVPILEALTVVEKVIGNPVMGSVVKQSRDSLEKGSRLSDPLKESWVFPPLVSHMTAIGEETGSLDYMLDKVADFYEDDVDRTVDSLKSMIEPLMIVVLAAVVGFIVMAILIPMFSIFTEIQ